MYAEFSAQIIHWLDGTLPILPFLNVVGCRSMVKHPVDFFVQCLFIIDGSVYNFYSMCQHLNDLGVNVMVYATRGCSGR